jgi:prepilin-type N-terminal cleavage/methylation domain-containing protein
MRKLSRKQEGFTLIELMIALTVFTVVLMMCVFGVIYVGRIFYKGVTAAKTQNVARVTTDDIVRGLQFNYSDSTTFLAANPAANEPGLLCMRGVAYKFLLYRQYVNTTNPAYDWQSTYGLRKQLLNGGAACPSLTDTSWDTATEQLGEGMRLTAFSVTPSATVDGWDVSIGVLFGDNDLLTDADEGDITGPLVKCLGSAVGSEFCSYSNLNLMVAKRL